MEILAFIRYRRMNLSSLNAKVMDVVRTLLREKEAERLVIHVKVAKERCYPSYTHMAPPIHCDRETTGRRGTIDARAAARRTTICDKNVREDRGRAIPVAASWALPKAILQTKTKRSTNRTYTYLLLTYLFCLSN